MEAVIRKAIDQDFNKIFDIEKDQIDAWSEDILKQDFFHNDLSSYLVATADEELVGFISIMNILGEIHVNNIAVDEKFRGNKIGEKLLVYGLNYYPKDNLIGYTLEVREDNIPAIKLYEKHGFIVVGKRKDYYKNKKAAIIMWKLKEEHKC